MTEFSKAFDKIVEDEWNRRFEDIDILTGNDEVSKWLREQFPENFE